MSICNAHRREFGCDTYEECPYCVAEDVQSATAERIAAWLERQPMWAVESAIIIAIKRGDWRDAK